jgi:hypothetical protein
VEGTLKLKGTKELYVTLAGSQQTPGSMEPGDKVWSGIVVEPGGKLEVEFAGFFHAPTGITSFSESVVLTNTYFKGSTSLRLPDGSAHELDPTFAAVNEMDFSKPDPTTIAEPVIEKPTTSQEIPLEGRMSAEEKQALLNEKAPKSSGGGKGWWWVLGGGVMAGAAGATYYYLKPTGEGNPDPSPNPENIMDPLPGFPTSP